MIWILLFSLAFAQDRLAPIQVIGSEAQELNKPNSSHFISKQKLERQQDADMTRVVKQVPGVYVREEEGFGLRPNIGLRGTNPDRSKKVNFMEDGVLIGPAPYSAPAAYFTPNMMHVEGLEVFKGVATVIYGPNSVGGSLNFLTPDPAPGLHGFFDGAYGSFDYGKTLGRIGYADDVYSILLQGGYHVTSGFKHLPDESANTGFEQSDFLLKARARTRAGDRPQFLDIKVGSTRENSHETYLGLTDSDFYADPYRRYAASELDHMKWHHETYQVSYTAALTGSSTLVATGYWHDFHRIWYRFDKFASATSPRTILNDPITHDQYYRVLTGEADSSSIGGGQGLIEIARNDRSYYSRGAQLYHLLSSGVHELRWGLRVHEDQIRRNHGTDYYEMSAGHLVRTGAARILSERDRDTSWSRTLFAQDEINIDPVRVTLALRYERVESEARDFVKSGAPSTFSHRNEDEFIVPGVGVLYNLTPSTSVFAGVNKGFAPVGPGQSNSVKPEQSTNYELGVRYLKDFFFEAIGFYSDYSNIKGICSFSAGCSASTENEEFNGGEATIYGVESRVRFDWFAGKFKFPFELNYTYTHASFDNSFQSGSPEWGLGQISSGAPLPYVPKQQYTLQTGVERGNWSGDLRFIWTGKQYDQAAEVARKAVPSYGVIDVNMKYRFGRESFGYLKVDNLLDNEYVVAYRPFGARPGKDRMVQAGLRLGF